MKDGILPVLLVAISDFYRSKSVINYNFDHGENSNEVQNRLHNDLYGG